MVYNRSSLSWQQMGSTQWLWLVGMGQDDWERRVRNWDKPEWCVVVNLLKMYWTCILGTQLQSLMLQGICSSGSKHLCSVCPMGRYITMFLCNMYSTCNSLVGNRSHSSYFCIMHVFLVVTIIVISELWAETCHVTYWCTTWSDTL